MPSVNPKAKHVAVFGTPRYGKTECAFKRVFGNEIRRSDRPGVVLIDPHDGFARKALIKTMEYGLLQTGKVIFDNLADTQNVPGYTFLRASDNPDPDQQVAENRESVSHAKSNAVRMEGKLDTSENQIIDEGLTNVFNLFIYQRTPIPFFWLQDAFNFESDRFLYLLDNCTDERTVEKFKVYSTLNPRDFEYKCGPAQRRIEKICSCPQFQKRCVETFDFVTFLNNGGIWIGSGESKGNLSREDMSFLFGMILLLVIQIARSGKLKRKVIVIIDEGMNAKLIDRNIARALAEAAKWNLEFWLIIQDPLSLPDDVRDLIFQCCDTKYFFRQVSPRATRFAAEIVAIPQLDPDKVKHVDHRTRTVVESYEEIKTKGQSVRKVGTGKQVTDTTGTHFRPIHKDVQEDIIQRYSFDEQVKLYEQIIATLLVGWCVIRSGSYVSKKAEYIEMLRMPWEGLVYQRKPLITLAEFKVQKVLEQVHQRPEYQQVHQPTRARTIPPVAQDSLLFG